MKNYTDIIYPNTINNLEKKNGYDTNIYKNSKNEPATSINPTISLIIPVYKEEKILESTLKYYTNEIRRKYNIELIISDGGSKDRTLEIAGKYADKIITHNKETKQTIAAGRNCGAEAAKGDIYVFINADTIPVDVDAFFEFVINWFNGKSNYTDSVAFASPVTVSQSEKIFKDTIFYSIHNFYIRMLNFLGIGMGRGECQVVRANIFKKIGGYNPNIIAGEDFDLYRRIAKIGKISFVKELKVYESPRRFRKYGYLRIIFSWIANSLSVMLFGKSISDEWEAVR